MSFGPQLTYCIRCGLFPTFLPPIRVSVVTHVCDPAFNCLRATSCRPRKILGMIIRGPHRFCHEAQLQIRFVVVCSPHCIRMLLFVSHEHLACAAAAIFEPRPEAADVHQELRHPTWTSRADDRRQNFFIQTSQSHVCTMSPWLLTVGYRGNRSSVMKPPMWCGHVFFSSVVHFNDLIIKKNKNHWNFLLFPRRSLSRRWTTMDVLIGRQTKRKT